MATVSTSYGAIGGRTAAYVSKELLKRAIPYLITEKFGQAKALPGNSTKTIDFRRYESLSATPAELTEGVTPAGQALTATPIQVTLKQYGGVVTVSDIIRDTHEDDVLNEVVGLLGEQAANQIETMRFGILKAGTNVDWANGGSRAEVNTPLTLALQRRATRSLKQQNARPITTIIRSTPSFGTENVAPAFIGFIHPDLETDLRKEANFTPAEKYGSITPWENEIGKLEDVRYLTSTIFAPYTGSADKGGAVGLMMPNDGTPANAMVYPVLYIARDAYAITALKGQYAVTPTVVNATPSDSDPLGQRGSVGWKTMQGAVILNQAYMRRLEVACTK